MNLIDPCLMTRTDNKGVMTLTKYVNDILLVGDKNAFKVIIEDIKTKFDIRKEGPLNAYSGCIIKFMNKEASIHQPHHSKKKDIKFKSLTEWL